MLNDFKCQWKLSDVHALTNYTQIPKVYATVITVHNVALLSALADDSTAGAVQACHDCSSVSSVPSSKVPRRLLHASLRSFRPPTSPFGQPSQTEYSAVLSKYFWHSVGPRRFGTHCLIRCVIRPSSLNALQAGLENASLCRTLETWAH